MLGLFEIGIIVSVGTLLFGGGILRRRARALGETLGEARKAIASALEIDDD